MNIPLVRLVFALACLAVSAAGAEGPQVFAIRGARVVRVSGPPIDDGTVVVRNGLIESVGANTTPPADAWVIDGKGLIVYPGLIDALSTWGIPGASPPPALGPRVNTPAPPVVRAPAITSTPPPVINGPEDRPSNTSYLKAADLIVANDGSIELARDTGFTTAVTFPMINIFAGQGVVFDLAGTRPGQMIVSSAAGLYLQMRSSGAFGSFPSSLFGVMAYIRQIYLDADHYKISQQIYDSHPQGLRRPAYDRTLEAVLESRRALLPARRAVEIDRMIRFAKELKMNAVLYGGDEGWRAADWLAAAQVPLLISLKWPERARDADPADAESLRELEMRDKAPSTPAALAKAGVSFAFYSDGTAPGRDMRRAVRRAIDAGLSPADAVRAMTLSPAEIYGVANRLGSIDPGKIANLVIADGDLFADKTKVKYVFVDGVKYEPLPDVPATKKNAEATK